MKNCLICNVEFVPYRGRVCCSPECQKIRKSHTLKAAKQRYRSNPENRDKGAEYMRNKRANDPSVKDRDREWKNNPEYKRKQREYQAKQRKLGNTWVDKNPELEKVRLREYYHRNKERLDRKNKEYNKLHPEYKKRVKAKRRSLERLAGSLPGAKTIAKRMKLLGGCCYCGKDEVLTLEHLIPLSKGGGNDKTNLFGACAKCNLSKNDKDWKEWFRGTDFYSKERENAIANKTANNVQLCLV